MEQVQEHPREGEAPGRGPGPLARALGGQLRLAAHDGDDEAARRLVARGADPLMGSNFAGSALEVAAARGHGACVAAILDSPLLDSDAGRASVDAALASACFFGHAHCAVALLARATPGWRDEAGETPLHLAAASGDAACLRALLPWQDARALNSDHWTPLMLAAFHGHPDCVEALLPASDASRADDEGSDALMLASTCSLATPEDAARCVLLLLGLADPARSNSRGEDAMMLACAAGHGQCARALAPRSDPRRRDLLGRSALMRAAEGGSAEALAAAMPGSDPRARDGSGRDALAWAREAGSPECAGRLEWALHAMEVDEALRAELAAGGSRGRGGRL